MSPADTRERRPYDVSAFVLATLSACAALLAAATSATSSFAKNDHAADGLLLRNQYDVRRANGYTLAESLGHCLKEARRKLAQAGRFSECGKSRVQQYFEKKLGLLNRHGRRPVLVLMPTQPKVAATMRRWHRSNEHGHLLAYLHCLADRYSFRIVDLSAITSFNGDADGFFDGVQVTRANADRMIVAIVKQAGDVPF